MRVQCSASWLKILIYAPFVLGLKCVKWNGFVVDESICVITSFAVLVSVGEKISRSQKAKLKTHISAICQDAPTRAIALNFGT